MESVQVMLLTPDGLKEGSLAPRSWCRGWRYCRAFWVWKEGVVESGHLGLCRGGGFGTQIGLLPCP